MKLATLLGYAAPYRTRIAFCGALMLLETVVVLVIPWLGGQFAAGLLARAQVKIEWVVLGLLGLLGGQALMRFVAGTVLSRTAEQVLADLRVRVYDHLQALPLKFYHERRQGDILVLLTSEVSQLSTYITGTLLSVVPLLLTLIGAIVLMVRIDLQLGVVVAVLIPFFFVILKVLGRKLRPLAARLQATRASAVATVEENLGLLPVIKAFTREALESARHSGQIRDVMDLSIAQQRIYIGLTAVLQFIAAASVVLLLWQARGRIGDGALTTAGLVSFLLYAALLARPASALAEFYGQTQVARGTLERLQHVLSERPEPLLGGGMTLDVVRGDVAFRGVGFAYPGRPAVFDNLDLEIGAGETVGLTGENGAGKSTLVHLLMRLHEPNAGQILIDGVDTSQVSLRSLRSHIGIVPQHVLLTNASLRDNIAYGRPHASACEIEDAARTAQAHAFIEQLPQGYETVIGDQGVRLSGGQRQRIALARALLKDPAILILDEATAMFDPKGEAHFIEQCRQALAGRTVLLITHRPSSLALADRILRIERGGAVPTAFDRAH